jgi:hypothetical protein
MMKEKHLLYIDSGSLYEIQLYGAKHKIFKTLAVSRKWWHNQINRDDGK